MRADLTPIPRRFSAWRSPLLTLALCGLMGAAQAADEGDSFSLKLSGNGQTQPSDVGLPVYAGARPYVENEGDRAAVSLGAWAGRFGLSLHVMKFRADAAPAAVAAFYEKALGRYGEVLDCRDPAARVKPPKDQPERLGCEERAPKAGTFEYRVGTRKSFRVVSVRPEGEGSRFDMAKIELGF